MRGLIPTRLIDRPKQGFGVPVYEWFFDKLHEQTRKELDDFCGKTDFLDRSEVMRLIDGSRRLRTGNAMFQDLTPSILQVWYLLNFALWWKEYIK